MTCLLKGRWRRQKGREKGSWVLPFQLWSSKLILPFPGAVFGTLLLLRWYHRLCIKKNAHLFLNDEIDALYSKWNLPMRLNTWEFLGPQAMTPICVVGPYVPPNSESSKLNITFSCKNDINGVWYLVFYSEKRDQLKLNRWLFSPLTNPRLTSHRHTFKCIGHLSSVLSFSGNSNALSLGNRLSNQVDLVGAEKLSPPKSLPKVMIPWNIVIFP